MAEIGFYHPDVGYWQANDENIKSHVLQSYPKGYVQVPIKPGAYYEWNGSDWVKDTQAEYEGLSVEVRILRDKELRSLDKVTSNPLRWASFTDEQKSAYADYRQALLDVPQQDGFPYDVTWPTKPE